MHVSDIQQSSVFDFNELSSSHLTCAYTRLPTTTTTTKTLDQVERLDLCEGEYQVQLSGLRTPLRTAHTYSVGSEKLVKCEMTSSHAHYGRAAIPLGVDAEVVANKVIHSRRYRQVKYHILCARHGREELRCVHEQETVTGRSEDNFHSFIHQ